MGIKSLSRFIRCADEVLQMFLAEGSPFKSELHEQGRFGGFMCVACPEGYPYLIVSVGHPNPEKLEKYLEFCQEKARRLASHSGHRLSYESRDPEQQQWGGAVRGEDYIVSFSGLPELLDEILSALVLYEFGEFSLDEVSNTLSGNSRATAENMRRLVIALQH